MNNNNDNKKNNIKSNEEEEIEAVEFANGFVPNADDDDDEGDDDDSKDSTDYYDCTLAYIRHLTTPQTELSQNKVIYPPSTEQLKDELVNNSWWELDQQQQRDGGGVGSGGIVRIPVDTKDETTCKYWGSYWNTDSNNSKKKKKQQRQYHSPSSMLFEKMFDWNDGTSSDSKEDETERDDGTKDAGRPSPPNQRTKCRKRSRSVVKLSPYFNISSGTTDSSFHCGAGVGANAAVATTTTAAAATATTPAGVGVGRSSLSPGIAARVPLWQEVGICLKHLLLNQIGYHCSEAHGYIALTTSFGQVVFLCTYGPTYLENEIWNMKLNDTYYMLRCHQPSKDHQLIFGYHCAATSNNGGIMKGGDCRQIFHKLVHVSAGTGNDDDYWRLQVIQILVNITKILNSLIYFGIPLTCMASKRKLVKFSNSTNDDGSTISSSCGTPDVAVQKTYTSPYICEIRNVKVTTMIDVYRLLHENHVPHTDQLLSVEELSSDEQEAKQKEERRGVKRGSSTHNSNIHFGPPSTATLTAGNNSKVVVCQFGPVGRCYKPKNIYELLDALVCVTETLVAIHSLNIMHRDIRWENVFHAISAVPGGTTTATRTTTMKQREETLNFPGSSREWILFDFEFAAKSPQPAFGKYTLTLPNHAPEMFWFTKPTVGSEIEEYPCFHTTAVDIWGLGYLIQQSYVDIPKSHASELDELQTKCMEENPSRRPTAIECLSILKELQQARPISTEKDVIVAGGVATIAETHEKDCVPKLLVD